MDTPGRTVTVSFQPNEVDRKLLARHVKRQRLRSFLPAQVTYGAAAWMILQIANRAPILQGVPRWGIVAAWILLYSIAYVFGSAVIITRSLAFEAGIRSAGISEDGLGIAHAAEGAGEFYPPGAIEAKNTSDGVYINRIHSWILIPARAFANGEEQAIFEEILLHAKEAKSRVRIPAGQIEGCPWTVTFQQDKGDAVHAYYHGWALHFLRSIDYRVGTVIGIAVAGVCAAIGLFGNTGIGVGLLVAGIILIMGAIASIVYLVSPSFPASVAQYRRPIAQPLTVGLGQDGIAVNDGRATKSLLWNDIRKIAADRRLIYLEARRDLLMIPRSAFLDAAQAEEFLAAAQAYRRGETPRKSEAAAPWPPPAIR